MKKTCIGAVTGLSPYYEENALGGSDGTHLDNTKPIL